MDLMKILSAADKCSLASGQALDLCLTHLTAAAPWLTHMWGQAVAETDMDAKPPASDPAEAAAKKEN